MKITCVGGGPAGLYFAIAAKLRDPGREITVVERDPRGATYGWGVGYWDDMLDLLHLTDPVSARAVRQASTLWKDQQIRIGSTAVYLSRYGFAAQRPALLEVLAERAADLGVQVEYDHPIEDLSELPDADLIVAADGAGSSIRQLLEDRFGTHVRTGANPYIWLGTDKVFDSFVFAFEETPAGWIWLYAYPSSDIVSTCVVECSEATWHGLGLDRCDEGDGLRLLEKIFAGPLEGHSLISRARGDSARWLRFKEISNRTWWHQNVVLIGDAAHTTHYTLGSGTRLAVIDAAELVRSLDDFSGDLTAALKDFDDRARPNLQRIQAMARRSMDWYEHADEHLNGSDPIEAASAMVGRCSSRPPRDHPRLLQSPVLRRLHAGTTTVHRWHRAARRGEISGLPAWHPGHPPAERAAASPGTPAGPRTRTLLADAG
ncbi:FAD-dependent monooxygenase [Geodermatophilus sp. SYSU D00708]